MKVVKNIKTNRLVYREIPDFKRGYGISNAVAFLDLNKEDLIEVAVTEEEWQEEINLREQEKPPSMQKQIDDLKTRVIALEPKSDLEMT